MNFQSIGIGAAIAAATVAVSAPAHAFTVTSLGGQNLSLEGNVSITRQQSPSNKFNFSFSNIKINENSSSAFTVGDAVNIGQLLNLESGVTVGAIDNFITGILLTSNEVVDFDVTRLLFKREGRDFTLDFDGNFVGATGEILGFGSLTTQVARGINPGQTVTRPLSGDIVAVPTPALLPAAIGFGAAMLRKRKGEQAEAEKETAEVNA
jgi:hypothetical protein